MLRLMKITLEIPSLACARCSAEAPIRPQLLYPLASVAPAFRSVMQEASKASTENVDGAEVLIDDDAGQTWKALMTERPIGWTALPTGEKGVLCGDCAAGWHNAAKAFMVPPPPPVVEEALAVAADAPAAAPAAPNFSGNKPSPFQPMVGAHIGTSPFQQAAGTKVSGPQNIVYGKPGSPSTVKIDKR